MKRDFNSWLGTMKDSIASWTYYTDFQKVYENVNKIKVELNILNSLIGSKNIEQEFKDTEIQLDEAENSEKVEESNLGRFKK